MTLDVNILAGTSKENSQILAAGQDVSIISDDERVTFSLSDSQLKSAINKAFGKSPNDAYLHSPTPWGDLYTTENWEQVKRTLTPYTAEILEITSELTIVQTQTLRNDSSVKGTFSVTISQSVTNTATSSWQTGGEFSVGEAITVKVGFLGTGAESQTAMSYSQSWGIDESHSESITLGSEAGLSVELEPGQAVIVYLNASRGALRAKVTYDGTLDGITAVNYDPAYKDHHFWGLDINEVMDTAYIPTDIQTTQIIEVGYYSNSSVTMEDLNTKQPVKGSIIRKSVQ